MTKLDQQWADGVIDGIKAFKLEIERLERVGEQLEEKMRIAEEALEAIDDGEQYGGIDHWRCIKARIALARIREGEKS